ncbi:MAG: hypothetical protein K2X66_10145 [Cyanobacteria bacterium]|nr:hypothetical protein [Cyanobacteriota bacterium]
MFDALQQKFSELAEIEDGKLLKAKLELKDKTVKHSEALKGNAPGNWGDFSDSSKSSTLTSGHLKNLAKQVRALDLGAASPKLSHGKAMTYGVAQPTEILKKSQRDTSISAPGELILKETDLVKYPESSSELESSKNSGKPSDKIPYGRSALSEYDALHEGTDNSLDILFPNPQPMAAKSRETLPRQDFYGQGFDELADKPVLKSSLKGPEPMMPSAAKKPLVKTFQSPFTLQENTELEAEKSSKTVAHVKAKVIPSELVENSDVPLPRLSGVSNEPEAVFFQRSVVAASGQQSSFNESPILAQYPDFQDLTYGDFGEDSGISSSHSFYQELEETLEETLNLLNKKPVLEQRSFKSASSSLGSSKFPSSAKGGGAVSANHQSQASNTLNPSRLETFDAEYAKRASEQLEMSLSQWEDFSQLEEVEDFQAVQFPIEQDPWDEPGPQDNAEQWRPLVKPSSSDPNKSPNKSHNKSIGKKSQNAGDLLNLSPAHEGLERESSDSLKKLKEISKIRFTQHPKAVSKAVSSNMSDVSEKRPISKNPKNPPQEPFRSSGKKKQEGPSVGGKKMPLSTKAEAKPAYYSSNIRISSKIFLKEQKQVIEKPLSMPVSQKSKQPTSSYRELSTPISPVHSTESDPSYLSKRNKLDAKSNFDDTLHRVIPRSQEVVSTVFSGDTSPEERVIQGVKLKDIRIMGGSMSELSGYKDLSKAPLVMGEDKKEGISNALLSSAALANAFNQSPASLAGEHFNSELAPEVDADFNGNFQTLIRLINELPEGVTKQTGAQIIRLTMESMGIFMEDVLSDAQAAQSEMLDAVRANIKKIEEYKTIIRKLETDIKYYQGKANELSEIIDLFILSNTSSKAPSMEEYHAR